ncbi:MAG TPA: LamG domain-containing protein [Rhodospirillales bacterium]|nr:LamG domain-containing protein [Rhodospirillales bacterium]
MEMIFRWCFGLGQLKLGPRMPIGGWEVGSSIKTWGGQTDTTDWAVANVDGKLAFVTGNKETDKDDIVASTKAISDGKWHHIALTRVRKSGVNTLYFDGVKDASLVKGLGLPVSNDVVMTIGGHPGGAAHAFAGAVDDMAIFTKVLSADEINLAIKSGVNKSSTAVKRNGKLTIMWGQLRTNL